MKISFRNGILLLFLPDISLKMGYAQQKCISGVIIDRDNNSLPRTVIVENDISNDTTTYISCNLISQFYSSKYTTAATLSRTKSTMRPVEHQTHLNL